jgi:hypothetical protein
MTLEAIKYDHRDPVWTQLEMVVQAEQGVLVLPTVLWTFEGPETYFQAGPEAMDVLNYARLVRTYDVGRDEGAALVIVALNRHRPVLMLLPLADAASRFMTSMWDNQARNRLLSLATRYRSGVASVHCIGEVGWAHQFEEIEKISKRVVVRLDEQMKATRFRGGLPPFTKRRNPTSMSEREMQLFTELMRKRCAD